MTEQQKQLVALVIAWAILNLSVWLLSPRKKR